MNFSIGTITTKQQIIPNTFVFRVQPEQNTLFSFIPGQYVFLRNPRFRRQEIHPFSIVSLPTNDYLEFCVKVYGDWTEKFSQLEKGATIEISEPQGNFTWDTNIKHAVFLLGGIGISPIISILRFLKKNADKPQSLVMLYGNRTPEAIAYKNELQKLQRTLPLKVVDIFSHLSAEHRWKGYRGFITENILKQEVNLPTHPTFFVVGPPIFNNKMLQMLADFSIPLDSIKQEKLMESPR